MKNERILVTGATGMIGSFVARRAVEAGYNVRVLARKNSDRTMLQGVDVEYAFGDLADQSTLPAALEGVDGGIVKSTMASRSDIGKWNIRLPSVGILWIMLCLPFSFLPLESNK